jgi:hypothetical protein
MKKITLLTLILFSLSSFSQVRKISYDTIQKYSVQKLKLKGSIVYDEYLSKDGYLYKVGDIIKINKPTNGDKFSFILDRFSQIQASSIMIGKDMVIKNIMVIGFKNKGYELCMTINDSITADNILKFESAVSFGEIKSKGMTSDDALSQLKRAKDKLDLGLISKEEYEVKKAELVKFIK